MLYEVITHISDRVAVMYLGRIVELTPADQLYKTPRHPYSEALLNAVPIPNPPARKQKRPLIGEIPSPLVITSYSIHYTKLYEYWFRS